MDVERLSDTITDLARRGLVVDLEYHLPRMPTGERRRHSEAELQAALIQRNDDLYGLKDARNVTRLWFVFMGARPADREWWQATLAADQVIVLATPIDVCLVRTASDPMRSMLVDEHDALVRQWWRQYQARPGEIEIRSG